MFNISIHHLASAATLCLALGFAGCKSTPPPTDSSLTTAIQARIASDNAISSEPIQASVLGGVVTLNGSVSNEAARSLASNDVSQVPGIKTVVNNLTVQSTPPPTATAAIPSSTAIQPVPVRTPKATIEPERRPTLPDRHSVPIERGNIDRGNNDRGNNDRGNNFPPPSQQQQAQQVAPPPPPPPPAPRSITVPAGTIIPVRVTQTLDSASTQPGTTFSGAISSDVLIDGAVAFPQGTGITGHVDAVQDAGHFKGNSLLTVSLTSINRRGDHVAVTSDPYSQQGNGRGKNTAEKVGGGAAVGAILGGIFGGGKGAAIGAGAGGGLGAGANAVTRGQQVQIPSESIVRFHLTNPVTVRVSTPGSGDQGQNSQDPSLQHR